MAFSVSGGRMTVSFVGGCHQFLSFFHIHRYFSKPLGQSAAWAASQVPIFEIFPWILILNTGIPIMSWHLLITYLYVTLIN